MSDYFDFRSALKGAYGYESNKNVFEEVVKGIGSDIPKYGVIWPVVWKNDRGLYAPGYRLEKRNGFSDAHYQVVFPQLYTGDFQVANALSERLVGDAKNISEGYLTKLCGEL